MTGSACLQSCDQQLKARPQVHCLIPRGYPDCLADALTIAEGTVLVGQFKRIFAKLSSFRCINRLNQKWWRKSRPSADSKWAAYANIPDVQPFWLGLESGRSPFTLSSPFGVEWTLDLRQPASI